MLQFFMPNKIVSPRNRYSIKIGNFTHIAKKFSTLYFSKVIKDGMPEPWMPFLMSNAFFDDIQDLKRSSKTPNSEFGLFGAQSLALITY